MILTKTLAGFAAGAVLTASAALAQTYPAASVTWMPRAVQPFRNEPCRAIGPSDADE